MILLTKNTLKENALSMVMEFNYLYYMVIKSNYILPWQFAFTKIKFDAMLYILPSVKIIRDQNQL